MVKYILKRMLYVVFVFFIISVIMFGIYKMVPGDPARMMVDSKIMATNPDQYEVMYEAAREKLGLDKPVGVQYFSWISNILTGDFGYSSQYRMPVIDLIGPPMINTVTLNIFSLIIVFAITIPLGIITAVKKFSIFDTSVQVFTVVGVSLPFFLVAFIFIFLFAIKIPIFPISGVNSPGFTGNGIEKFVDMLYHMALPLIVMTVGSLAGITRYVRGAMIEVLRQDYIRTARAKGLKEKVVIYSHAFKNALIPVVTIVTGWFVSIFGGSVVIESIFMWNGIGNVLFTALKQQDFAVVLAMNMFYTVLTLVGNLIMDLSYVLVDPRVKFD